MEPPQNPPEAPISPAVPVAFGPFVLNTAHARLTREGHAVALTGRPLAVLALFAARAGQLIDKGVLLDAVWGHRHVSPSMLKVVVNTLRTALGDDAQAPHFIETVPRRGYRFVAEVRPLGAENAAAAPGPTATRGNLPPAQSALVGRQVDSERLAALLQAHRLVTLTGLGGVGKTRLALAVAAGLQASDGVWLLRLDALADGAPLLAAIAQTLRLGATARADADALARALAGMQLQLVLDNAEHVADAVAAALPPLLAAAPGLRVLVTSQLPLRLVGEQVMPLAPLALPAPAAPAPDPAAYAAAQLLCDSVRRWIPQYRPTAAEHADIAEICRALDGMPLALELAAARVPLLGMAGVRARLDQRFALLTNGARDAAVRQRTLAAALDWTYSLLSPEEQRALRRLAVCAGSFTPEAAEALLADDPAPLDRVEALHQRSLLITEPAAAGARLRLFDSVRRHALARAAQAGDEDDARKRHQAWTLQRFERADAEEFETPLLAWLAPLRLEIDNLRAALRFGLADTADARALDTARRLAACSARFWSFSGHRAEGHRWLSAAAAGPPASTATAALLDHGRGVYGAMAQLGSPQEALTALRRARPVLEAAGDARRCYLSLYAERLLLVRLQPHESAADLPLRMRKLLQAHWGTLPRRWLAMLDAFGLRDSGEHERYRQACDALLLACRAAGATMESWQAALALTQALVLLGRLDEARAVIAQAAEEVRALGLVREQAPLLATAACLHLWQPTRTPEAIGFAAEASRLLLADGMLWWMADALPWLAWHDGRRDDAARLLAWADGLVTQRAERRGPMFGGMRDALAGALANALPSALHLKPGQGATALADEDALALAFGRR